MSLKARYLGALLIIAVAVSVSALTIQYLLSSQANDAEIINRAGQQRMLSQRISLAITRLSLCPVNATDSRETLRTALEQFNANHQFLIQLPNLTPALNQLYFNNDGLDTFSKKYHFAGSDILTSQSCSPVPSIFQSGSSDTLLSLLNDAVVLFEAQAKNKVERVRTFEYYLWILTLMLLAAEAVLIFIPMEKRITNSIEALKASTKAAQAANHAKSEFLANMSHELRTPMNGMFGMIELAMDNPGKATLYLKKALAAGGQLLTLINDILDLSKIEAGKLIVVKERFNLLEILDDLATLYVINCQRKGLTFDYVRRSELPAFVVGDSKRIAQVLHNLLSNAIKFTHDGKVSLEVSISQKAQQLHLNFTVTDSGIGISKEKAERIFNEFEQGDQSTTKLYGGTGLGLSIAKRLTELMNGQLSLNTDLPKGSQFCFSLPVTIPAAQPVDVLPAGRVSAAIVDDLQTSREYLGHLCREMGVEVTLFGSAKEFLASEDYFNAVLIDLSMPEIDGMSLLNILNEQKDKRPPFIMIVSAVLDHFDARPEIADMVWRTYAKPVNREKLEADILQLQAIITSPHNEADKPATHKVEVLVAEDNDINAEVIRYMLESLGCEVTVAENGQKAVDAVQLAHFDIILMDVQMPELNGIEATKIIRNVVGKKDIPIIALTANAYAEDRKRCLDAGMNDFLTKPVSQDKVVRMVERFRSTGSINPK